MFCAYEIRRREVDEACRCACPDGIAPSKVSTSDDANTMEYSSSHLLNRVTVAASAMSAILNLSERRCEIR